MRKAKQITGLLMAGIMASTVLAGCTNEPAPSSTSQAEAGKDSGAGSSAPAALGDQITLRFMWWGGDERNEATLAVIDQYQKLHPEVRIEAEMNSDQGYIDKVSTMLANGTAPDILQQNVDSLPDFVSRGDFFVDFYEYKDTFTPALTRHLSASSAPLTESFWPCLPVCHVWLQWPTKTRLRPAMWI